MDITWYEKIIFNAGIVSYYKKGLGGQASDPSFTAQYKDNRIFEQESGKLLGTIEYVDSHYMFIRWQSKGGGKNEYGIFWKYYDLE